MNISDLMNNSSTADSNNPPDRKSRSSQPPSTFPYTAESEQRQHESQVLTPPLRQHHGFAQPRGTPPADIHASYSRPSLDVSRSNSVVVTYPHATPTRTTPGPVQYSSIDSPRYAQPPYSQSPVHGPGPRQPHYQNVQRPPSSSRYPAQSQPSPVPYADPHHPGTPTQVYPSYDRRIASGPAVYERESATPSNGYPPQPRYGTYPHPQAQPNTPLGPPMPRRGSSFQTQYQQHDAQARRMSVSGHHTSQSPMSSVPTGLPHNTMHPHLAERQQSLDVQRTRTSPSLSPRSVPPRTYSQSTSRNPSYDHFAHRPSPHSSQEPSYSQSEMASRPPSQALEQDPSLRPRQTKQHTPRNRQRISSILSGPTESPQSTQMDDRPRDIKSESGTRSTPPRSLSQVPRIDPQQKPPLSDMASSPTTSAIPPTAPSILAPAEEPAPARAPPAHKRPAEESADISATRKRPRRKYDRPPIWARLAPGNPRYNPDLHRSEASEQRVAQNQPVSNGQPIAQQDAQLLEQKVRTSGLLEMPWEMSITDVVPSDEILTQVATFLYRGMLQHPELAAGQAGAGNLEIEAKLGHFEHRNEPGRLRLPVTSTVVLDPGYAREHLQFVSNMNIDQHKHMNDYLNERVQDSVSAGRVAIKYTHRRELDSFRTLSPLGKNVLPPFPASEVNPNHTLKLRTTHNVDPKSRSANMAGPGPVIARIVKRRLHDLSIYSPLTDYDLRISINVEVDLMHHPSTEGLDPETLAIPLEDDKNRQPERFKDRLSYAHCAYSIDLTQVTLGTQGEGTQTHELEVEVDTVKLRDQAQDLRQGLPNAFESLVQGLLSNCFLLMRVRGS